MAEALSSLLCCGVVLALPLGGGVQHALAYMQRVPKPRPLRSDGVSSLLGVHLFILLQHALSQQLLSPSREQHQWARRSGQCWGLGKGSPAAVLAACTATEGAAHCCMVHALLPTWGVFIAADAGACIAAGGAARCQRGHVHTERAVGTPRPTLFGAKGGTNAEHFRALPRVVWLGAALLQPFSAAIRHVGR